MLSELIPKVRSCSDQFSRQAVANALYGLQGMSSDNSVVVELLSVLVPKVQNCSDQFKEQTVAIALYGLQSMSSEIPVVVSALIPKVRSCSDQFKGQAVANALYGLQGMSSEVPVVVELLSVLTPKTKSCSCKLTGQNVANALYGLQGMSSNVPVVAELLSALIPKAQNCSDQFTEQEIANALYGLHGMSSDVPVVVELLAVLVFKAQIMELMFTARHIGNILYGLQNIKYELSLDFVDALVAQVLKSDTNDATFYHESQGFVSLNVALNSLVQSGAYNSAPWLSKIENVLTNLTVALERQPCPVTCSKSELQIVKIAECVPWGYCDEGGGVSVEVTSNVWLHGFEADIVLTVSRQGSARRPQRDGTVLSEPVAIIINVEIDGPHHRRKKSRTFCTIRDERMRRKGIRVARWDFVSMERKAYKKSDIETMFLAEVKKSLELQ